MAILDIPITNTNSFFSISCELEGIAYILRFNFNIRAGLWHLDILTPSGTVLVAGIPILPAFPLLKYRRSSSLPPGYLFAFDTQGLDAVPGRDDLGGRTKLIYIESE